MRSLKKGIVKKSPDYYICCMEGMKYDKQKRKRTVSRWFDLFCMLQFPVYGILYNAYR